MRRTSLLPRLGETLWYRDRWRSPSELAQALDAPPGSLHPWLNHLHFHRILWTDEERMLRVDRNRLLSVLTAHRSANIRPETPTPSTHDEETIQDLLRDADITFLYGFFTAANQWAFFEPRQDIYLYVAPTQIGNAKAALGSPKGSGNRYGRSIHLFGEPPSAIQGQTRDDIPVTTPFQTVLDLQAHPEGGAHAAFLKENILPRKDLSNLRLTRTPTEIMRRERKNH